jgi:hypothetical protein
MSSKEAATEKKEMQRDYRIPIIVTRVGESRARRGRLPEDGELHDKGNDFVAIWQKRVPDVHLLHAGWLISILCELVCRG